MSTKKLQTNFKRIETKYILSRALLERIEPLLAQFIQPDDYPTSTISNVYYDSEDFEMIRNAIENPTYKEKLRMRTYAQNPQADSPVFIEIKKKHEKVGYKSRVTTTLAKAQNYLNQKEDFDDQTEIKQEIDWMCKRYPTLQPKMYISYNRKSFKGIDDSKVRVTFDHDVMYRSYDLDVTYGPYGDYLLDADSVIMEVKVPEEFPAWLAAILFAFDIQPVSFSKYGVAYRLTIGEEVEVGQTMEVSV